MKAFAPYADYLETLAYTVLSYGSKEISQGELDTLLDGKMLQPIFVKLVPLSVRRKHGAFFTSSLIRRQAISVPYHEGRIVDPACGAGDLLVECTRYLPIQADLKETLTHWGMRIHGRDIHQEFVRATRARLALAAAARLPYFRGLPLGNVRRKLPRGNPLKYGRRAAAANARRARVALTNS